MTNNEILYIESICGISIDKLCHMTKEEQHKFSLEHFGKAMIYKKDENGNYLVIKEEKQKRFSFKKK